MFDRKKIRYHYRVLRDFFLIFLIILPLFDLEALCGFAHRTEFVKTVVFIEFKKKFFFFFAG